MNTPPLILNSSIAQGLDIIGDRWSLLILREAFYGCSRFEDFIKATGASRATLTRRLGALVDSDILYKRPYSQGSNRFEYCFTETGIALLGASLLAHQWDITHTESDKAALKHSRCGHALRPQAVCRHCKQALEFDDVAWKAGENTVAEQLSEIQSIHKQRRNRDASKAKVDTTDLVYLIGDRWTLLILIGAFFGTCRYDDFIKLLHMAPGILSERLKTLVSANIMQRHSYQSNPPRHEYRLTAKGKSVFPFVMALREWAIDLQPGYRSSEPTLIHTPCQHALTVDVVCGHCHEKPWPRDISVMKNQ